jgi:hypothetical protein
MHRKSHLATILAAVLLLSSLPTTPARADPDPVAITALAPVTSSDGRFGMVQGIQAPDLAYQAGSRWDRVIFPWSLIQKDGPDAWNEQYFSDAAIRAQAGRGVTMVGLMIYTPQWASVTPATGRPVDRPQGLNLAYNDPKNLWGQFVRRLAARQKGVVDNWIIWNEQDLYDMAIRYTWDGSYEEYLQLLKTAYLNIKEVNPQAKVIVGGFAYWWDKENNRPPYLGPLLELIARDPDHQRNNEYFDARHHGPAQHQEADLDRREQRHPVRRSEESAPVRSAGGDARPAGGVCDPEHGDGARGRRRAVRYLQGNRREAGERLRPVRPGPQ